MNRTLQGSSGFYQLALQLNTLVNFLCQHLVDLCQLLSRVIDFALQRIGFLQRPGDVAGLNIGWNFLLQHSTDHQKRVS